MVEGRVIGERLVGNIGDECAMVANAQARLRLDCAYDDPIQAPLGKDPQHLSFAALGSHQQHPLLAL